ncbi:MarR family winged helix-turn-helix transcriptional regulator [Shouchella patagoniensis]|uniref:MarR family winged helix-turn-helix transcriptional regulator n=1 Tax=Shouchella patagoniensis TaxID=228576 RepID=UPI00147327BD|nr:MarR family transcriptional regulator [Shouchella patagoniensis]
MEKPNHLIDSWVHYAKFYARLSNALDSVLQQQYQLNINEFYLLYFLSQADQNKLRLSELHPKVGLSQSALSRLVSRMEDYRGEQIVTRSICEDDKRGTFIKLSASGETLLSSIRSTLDTTLNESLSSQDIEHILAIVTR